MIKSQTKIQEKLSEVINHISLVESYIVQENSSIRSIMESGKAQTALKYVDRYIISSYQKKTMKDLNKRGKINEAMEVLEYLYDQR